MLDKLFGRQVNIKKLTNTAKIPTKGSDAAAGYDLYADLDGADMQRIDPHETVIISTGIAMELPKGTFLGIYPRSGLATKQGLRPANCVRSN